MARDLSQAGRDRVRRQGRAVAAFLAAALVMAAGPSLAASPAVTTTPGGAAVPAEPQDEGAPMAGGPPARASLSVDTVESGAPSPVLLRRIEELGDIELRRAEILPGRSTSDPVIHVRVRALKEGGYAIESSLADAGGVVERSARTVLCNLCTEGETVERARGEVVRLVPFVRGHAEAGAQGERSGDGSGPVSTSDGGARLGARTKVGIALAAAGAAGVGVGLGLALREPTPRPEMPLETLDTRVPGYVALGVGGALVVTGVILALRGRVSPGRGRVRVAIGPQGVVLGGRF